MNRVLMLSMLLDRLTFKVGEVTPSFRIRDNCEDVNVSQYLIDVEKEIPEAIGDMLDMIHTAVAMIVPEQKASSYG